VQGRAAFPGAHGARLATGQVTLVIESAVTTTTPEWSSQGSVPATFHVSDTLRQTPGLPVDQRAPEDFGHPRILAEQGEEARSDSRGPAGRRNFTLAGYSVNRPA
jgi:hypothetical protein